jgi:hypothetical protein
MDILAGFNENFQPFSKVEDLVITPNYETRSWEIDLTISVSDFNYVVSFSGSLANLVNQ